MKKLSVVFAFTLTLFAGQIYAALPFYEPFADATASGGSAYTVGSKIAGQTNANGPTVVWADNNTGAVDVAPTNATGNLSYPGLPTSTGNMSYFTNVTARTTRVTLPSTITTGTVYYSYKLQLTSIANLAAAGAYLNGFSAGTGNSASSITTLGARLWAKKIDANNYVLGISKNTASVTAEVVFDTTQYTTNDVLFIVGGYTFSGSALNDTASLWINPGSLGAASAPAATVPNTGLTFANASPTVASFLFGNRATTIAAGNIDDIRVANNWKDVTAGVTITGQPTNQTVNAGGVATFAVVATQTGASFQWKRNGTNLVDGGNISGATSATLTLTGVFTADADSYTVDVIGSNTETSTAAILTVIDPAITTQPIASAVLVPGSTTNLFVVASGTPTVTYQWQKNGANLSDGGSISGATTASLTLSSVTAADDGAYTCAVTNGLASGIISSNAVISVANDPDILTQPTSITNNYGDQAVFTVAASGTPTLTYQWQKNGSNLTDGGNIAGATTASLTIILSGDPDEGNYQVIVTNGLSQSVTSSIATLTVNDPIITAQPASTTNAVGSTATFTVVATGTPTLTYQWRKAGIDLTDGGNISGAMAATLSVSSISSSDATNYSVIVSNSVGSSVTSSSATLTVLSPPTITSAPVSRTVAVGANVGFIVTATGQIDAGPLTYQWQSNAVDIAGATTNSYAITNVQLGTAATYSVIVSNNVGAASASAILTVVAGNIRLHETNLVVLRFNNGTETFAGAGNSLHLDQYTTSGAYVSSLSFPDTGSSALIVEGTATAQGYLTRSANGRLVTFGGFNSPRLPTGQTLGTNTATAIPRVVATVNGLSVYNPAVINTASTFNGQTIRSATTDGTNNFWIGTGSTTLQVYYDGLNSAAVKINAAASGVLGGVAIFNGDLYFGSRSAVPGVGIYKFTGLPTNSGNAFTTNFSGVGGSFYDYAVSPSGTIIYLADETASAAGGIRRFDFSGTWTQTYVLGSGAANIGCRSLEVDWSGPSPIIYATTAESSPGPNRIISITDSNATAVATTIASSGPVQLFRGIKFGPVADAPAIAAQPASSTNFATTTATFSVTASGTGPFNYQWQKDGVNLVNGGNVSGATSHTLTLSSLTGADAANTPGYSVIVTSELGNAISDPATLTIAGPPTVNVSPSTITIDQGANTTFTADTTGLSLSYQWYHGATLLGGATESSLTVSNVQPADTIDGWTVVVTNLAGSVTSTPAATVSLVLDSIAPKVTVSTPGKSKGTNVASINVTGVAKDSGAGNSGIISSVKFGYNAGNVLTGAVTNETVLTDLTKGAWGFATAATIPLTPGTNIISVIATDLAGNSSVPAPFIFYYDLTNDLVLTIVGSGEVKMGPTIWSGSQTIANTFKVGRPYKFDGYVGKGTNFIFTNWVTGPVDVGSSTNKWVQKSKLSFIMQENMTVTANFATNRFTAAAGTYNGLFSETATNLTHETAGFVQVKAKDKSVYSGYLLFDGVKRPFSGKFDTAGTATQVITRTKTLTQDPVTLSLALDLTPGEVMTGTVGISGTWTSSMTADKVVFSVTSPETTNVGLYTLQLPTSLDAPSGSPGGVGYSTVTNSPIGISAFKGLLADGQKISLKMNQGRDGHVPFYVGLYKHATLKDFRGSLMGWITFTNTDFGPSADNVLTWIKKGNTDVTAQYAAGFSNSVEVAGSPYVPTAPGTTPIALNTGDYVIVSDGNLSEPVTNVVVSVAATASGTKVTLNKTNTLNVVNKATINFNHKDGTFIGGFLNPTLPTKTQGAVLQNTGSAAGYFLKVGNTESGTVRIEDQTP